LRVMIFGDDMKIIFKRGSMLLQTLVMCVIMSMIGVMVLKWVMARYMLSTKLYRSSVSKVRLEGCMSGVTSSWNAGVSPPNCIFDNGKTVTYTTSGNRIDYKIDPDI